jgi:hypothetical protein
LPASDKPPGATPASSAETPAKWPGRQASKRAELVTSAIVVEEQEHFFVVRLAER